MEKVVHIARSHQESEEHDLFQYRRMTRNQRVECLLELVARHPDYDPEQRLERVYRITRFPSR